MFTHTDRDVFEISLSYCISCPEWEINMGDTTLITKIGNASLAGATKMLLSIDSRYQLEKTTKNIEHIELETIPTFFDFFVDGWQFKKMEI